MLYSTQEVGYRKFCSSSKICALIASFVKYPLGLRRITSLAYSPSEQTVTKIIFTFGLIFLIFKLLERRGIFERVPILRPIAFSALWIVFEWSSTLGWTGVPWGRLCIGQSEYLPVLQSASLLGPYFVSFLIIFILFSFVSFYY